MVDHRERQRRRLLSAPTVAVPSAPRESHSGAIRSCLLHRLRSPRRVRSHKVSFQETKRDGIWAEQTDEREQKIAWWTGSVVCLWDPESAHNVFYDLHAGSVSSTLPMESSVLKLPKHYDASVIDKYVRLVVNRGVNAPRLPTVIL